MKMVQQRVSSSGSISSPHLSMILSVLVMAVGVAAADEPRVELSGFRGNGGRVAWSPTGEFVVFDRREADGGFDLYLTEDFETERCLTCNHPDLPNPKRNYGQPAIHPDGRYVVFQAEKQEHPFVIPLATNPGAGVFNDLWLYDLESGRATVLWEVANDKSHGVLHPQFSKDGRKLSWSELVGAADFKVPGKGAGVWVLKTADFSPRGLTKVKQYQPGEDVIYENHGFSHDGEWLYFSSNMKRSRAVNEATDIYKLHLGTGELVRLTHEGYNEHAHLSPDGKVIVWMSSVGLGDTYDYYRVGTEYWLMNADGSNKRRLTHLNDPEHPHFRGRHAIVADFDFFPTSSKETGYRLLAYLHELVTKNLSIPSTNPSAKGEYNFFVDFTLGSAVAPPTPSNSMIHAVGTHLVDGNGDPIQLRGVLLEGWLMWNGTLWGAGLTSETKLSERIEDLVGREEAARFRKAVYDTFITERDIEMIADLGFNVVRVPFNHTVLEKNGAVDDSAPGWFYLDRLLDWCENHQVYVVLDLHSVPKGQSGVFVADPDAKHVWTSEESLQRTVDIWKAIAVRYRDRSIVAGYDLINEPEPPQDHELIDLYRRIIEAIRVVDSHHLVFLTGKALSTDFSFFDGPLDDNQAYTFHTYNFFSHDIDEANLAKLASIAREHNVPLWNGEFGAHTDRWTSSQIELFEDPSNHVNGWIYWPWKRVSENDWRRERFGHLMEIESTKPWDTVRKHLGSIFGWKKIPKELARRGLADFIEASKAENLVADERMVTALQGWHRPSGSGPPPKPSGDEVVRKVESPRSLTRHIDNVKVVRADGGRVSWHRESDLIAFDAKGEDGLYDIHVMRPDGSGQRCLTCDGGGVLPQKNNGQPAWHPSGSYLVFQSEMKNNPRDSNRAQPGLGVFMNLWLMDLEGQRFWQLTDLPATGDNGVLHPHFSSDGSTLTWSQLTKGGNPLKPTGLLGYWKLKIADFGFGPTAPVLGNIREYEPGGPAFYENHGLSPDGRYLLFTSNSGAEQILQLSANDIYRLDLETREVIQLTEGSYNEVAHWSPNGRKIIWMSSRGNPNKGTDYWMMNPDGSGKTRLTNFNDPQHPVTKAPVFCADFAWGPGSKRLVAYIQKDLITQDGMTVMIELAESTVRAISEAGRRRSPPRTKHR